MAGMLLAHLASSMLALFVINLLWFTYTYVITFFYLPTENSKFPPSLMFYFLTRFFSSLIAAHKCFTNRQKVGFSFPKFYRHWISVAATNTFIRIVPFMFEIHTLMLWLSRTTLVPLVDFFIIRDTTLQLEVLIARQTSPSYRGPPRVARTYLIGGLFLFGLALLCVPLFFMWSAQAATAYNPPRAAELEIGIGSLPPFHMSAGVIDPASTRMQQEIADFGRGSWNFMVVNPVEALSLVNFPTFSYYSWSATGQMWQFVQHLLNESSDNVVPYVRITFHFDYPTSTAGSTDYSWLQQGNPWTREARNNLLQVFAKSPDMYEIALPDFELPSCLVVPALSPIYEIADVKHSVAIRPAIGRPDVDLDWDVVLGNLTGVDSDNSLDFLLAPDHYKLLVWSQPVNPESWTANVLQSSAGVLVVYIVVIIAIGFVIRDYSAGQGASLWIDKMERTHKLYAQIMAIDAHGRAGEIEKEKDLADEFLQTLRSREKVLKLTAADIVPTTQS
jgi:hypothetical protein